MNVDKATVRVRELDWSVGLENGEETHYVDTILGRYAAWVQKGIAYVIVPDAMTNRLALSKPAGLVIEDAKRAAQAHFEAAIRSVIA